MKKILLLISLYTIHFSGFLHATPAPYVSTISRVYGNYYSPAVAQNPNLGEIGTLNLGFGTNGSLDVSEALASSQAKAVRFLLDGTAIVLLSSLDSTVVSMYSASGIFQNSYPLADANLSPIFMQLDSQENILVGGHGGWLQRMSSAGVIDTAFATEFNLSAGSWTFIGNIAEQSTGDLIITGLKDGYTQVARLLSSGRLDTTFGTDGYVIFNATTGETPLLHSTTGAYNVVVTQDDSILVAYADSQDLHAFIVKFVVNGQFAMGFGQHGIRTNAVGASPVVPDQIRTSLDGSNNIIVGATIADSPTNVGLLAFNADSGAYADGIFPMNIPSSGGNAIELASIIVLSNGYIVVVSSDVTNKKMRVDQFMPDGFSDSAFNAVTTANPDGTPGYIEFFVTPESGMIVASSLSSAAIAPNGQLYVAGFQTTYAPSTTIPYLSQIYEFPYVYQVPQYPSAIAQGTINSNFGGSSLVTYTGIVNPYLGKYRGNLQQHATSVIVNNSVYTLVGDLIVGMYGSTDSSSSTCMMLNWLTPSGMFEEGVGSDGSGQLILTPAEEGQAESLLALAQEGGAGALYVAGAKSSSGAILRKYSSDSTSAWTEGTAEWSAIDTTASDAQGVGIAFQGRDLVLLFENLGTGDGRIVGYDAASGALANGTGDLSFGIDGSGSINATSYGMNMGPVYGAVINSIGSMFIAYKNTSTGFVDIAALNKDGSALISTFGTSGIALNIFGWTSEDISIEPSSVRIAFDAFGYLIVSAVDTITSHVFIAQCNQIDGALNPIFGVDGIATMTFTNPTITQLHGISDGSIMFTGSWNGTQMYIARVRQEGLLDTTFNSQATMPGVLIISPESNPYAAVATDFALQTLYSYTGDIVVVGSQDMYSTDATPMVTSVFGQMNTTMVKNYPVFDQYIGTLDRSLNDSGGLNLASLISDGTAQVMYAYPSGSVYEGMLLIGVDTGTSTNIARFDTRTLRLDETFNASGDNPGMYTASDVFGIADLMVDAKGRIVFVGTSEGFGWGQRLNVDGTFDTSFEIPTTPVLSSITCVAQQQSGRYIIAGGFESGSYGLAAFQDELVAPNTTLQLDATFNPTGLTSSSPGTFTFTGFPVYSIVINHDDTILPAWAGGDDSFYIGKIMANGAGYVTTFGNDGIANTHIVPSNPLTGRIALDSAGNIIAAASTSDDDMQVVRYTPAGVIDDTWNDGHITTLHGFGHSVKLTSLIESTSQQTILLGYNTVRRVNGIHGPMFAVSVNAEGILDATWNPHADLADVPGILTYSVEGSTIMGTGAFAVNGNLYAVGGTGTEPLLMELVANGILATQEPLATNAGILDITINTQDTDYDALNVNSQLGLAFGTPVKLHIMNDTNGEMLMGSMIGTTAYITKLNADLSLDVQFNIDGSNPGTLPISNVASLQDLFVADASGDGGTIYATGLSTGDAVWAEMISSEGIAITTLTAANTLATGTAIRQGSGNILIAGQSSREGNFGCIAAFNDSMTSLDTSFGNGVPGYYISEASNPIAAMTLDDEYRIYIAYKQGTSLIVQRITANGSAIDMNFSDAYSPESCNPYLIKMVLDQVNNRLIVANYHNSGLYITRYNTLNGSLAGTGNIGSLQLSDLFVDTDQNIYVVSYSTESPYQTIVARFNSVDAVTIALDPNYAADGETPGIAAVAITPLAESGFSIGAAILHPDRRVYVVGATNEGIPYMARFFGDNYATQISQAIPAQSPGDFDVTYGSYHGYAVTFAGHASYDTGYHQQVKAVRHLNSTNLMAVVDDGTNSWTVRVLQDGTNDPSYGPTPGGQGALITKLTGNEVVTGMIVSGVGEYFVIGTNDTTGTGYLKKITATGAMDQLFGGNTGSPGSSSYSLGTVYGLMSNPCAVAELTNGNVVIAGNNAGVGTMQMVNPNGFVLTTFGNGGQFINGANIASISVDASNNIYAAIGYLDGESKSVRVVALDATGSLISSFGVGGIVDAVMTNIADYQNIQLALDKNANLVVAATAAAPVGGFGVIQLEPNGTIDSGFNSGSQLNIELPHADTAVANLAQIVTLQDRNMLIAGHQQDDATPDNNANFVACIDDAGALKTTFNRYQTQGSIPGIAIFKAPSASERDRELYSMDIQANGQIILAGAYAPMMNQWVPITIRLIGYENVQAILQYPGDVPETPSVLNPSFNGTGVSSSDNAIETVCFVDGEIALDSNGNIISVCVTEEETFKIVRFLADGTFDENFGIDSVGTSPTITNLAQGCSIAIDSFDNVFIGGITTNNQFVVVKFNALGVVDTSYGTDGTPGVSITDPHDGVSLVSGGNIAINSLGQLIIAGYSSTAQFVMNQLDSTGNSLATYASQIIPNLMNGGYVAFDSSDNLYIGGATSLSSLVAVKYNQVDDAFVQDATFNVDSGVATALITDFVAGGAIAIDSNDNIVIGGYTLNQTLAVARWTSLGILDPLFNETGIAYSEPIVSLLGVGSVAVGSLDDVIIGGYARNYSGYKNMVVAVFTTAGVANTEFSATGTGTTGDILLGSVALNTRPGGFVAINSVGQILLGGIQPPSVMFPITRLVVAEMYSGYETFITDPSTLSPENLKTFYYGNNKEYLNAVLGLTFLINGFSDASIGQIIFEAIQLKIDEYIAIHQNVPGYNLTWHLFLLIPSLQALETSLIGEYESLTDEITDLFASLIQRINGLKIS